MRVLVTGASGFIGSYVAAELLDRGHEVAVLLRKPDIPWRLAEVFQSLHVIRGSLDDAAGLLDQLSAFAPQAIAHLAWDGVFNVYRNDPAQVRNIARTVEFLAVAAKAGVQAFVGAGSQAEYGPYARPIREDDAPRPTTLYGKAKLAARSLGEQVAMDRGVRFAWLRTFSAYGPRDHDGWLIPQTIAALLRKERMALTACEQRWSFVHVRDVAAAFRYVLEDAGAAGIFNVAGPDAPPLRKTLECLRDLIDPAATLGFGDIGYRPDQVMVLEAETGRLRATGWQPRIDLERGLRETIAWYAHDHKH